MHYKLDWYWIRATKQFLHSQSQSKIIIIAVLTPKLGEGLESIDELKKSELVSTTDLKKIKNYDFSFEVIWEKDTLKPGKFILKN